MTTPSSIVTRQPRRPRKRSAPSQRDQQIYVAYSVSGKTQLELAAQHKLTQCRISQIVRRVEAWRSQADPGEEGELSERQQQRLDRWLEHERLDTVCRDAMRCFHTEQRTVKTTKKGHRGTVAYDEETSRELPANVQFLKVVLQANSQLSRLEQKEPLPQQDLDQEQRQWMVHQELQRLRQQAEESGHVHTSGGGVCDVVEDWLGALVGRINEGGGDDDIDAALRELSRAILPNGEGAAERQDEEEGEAESGRAGEGEGEAPAEPSSFLEMPISNTYPAPDDSPQVSAAEYLAPTAAAQKTPPGPPTASSPARPVSRSPARPVSPSPDLREPWEIEFDRRQQERERRQKRLPHLTPLPAGSPRPRVEIDLDGAPCPPDSCDPLDLPERLQAHLTSLVPVVTER